jgi:type I restriction enzyme S subunit
MSSWRACTIGDLVKEKVIFPPMDGNHGEIHPKGNDFIADGIPFVMASDINAGLIDFSGCKFIKEEQASSLRKGFSLEGDVLLTHKASIGRTALVPKTKYSYLMLTPQVTYYRVIDKDVLDNRFLKYYFDFKYFQETLGLWAGAGSTRAYIGITNQHNLPVRIPNINTQKRIADVLTAIDKKIELNNKINAELEAMAKLIYDYWFVQFDFPDANGKPYKSSGGKMVYNGELKREIPEGWDFDYLGSIEPNIITGKTPPTVKPENFNGDIPFICIGDVRGNMHVTSTDLTLSNIGADSQPNKYIPEGSICVTCIASPGLVGFATEDSQTNQQLNTIVCGNFENRYYLYFYLKDYFRFSRAKSGNTFANMNKGDFSSIKVIRPRNELLKSFSQTLRPSVEQILVNSKENNRLKELRDWLLPMLMNGQVTICKK